MDRLHVSKIWLSCLIIAILVSSFVVASHVPSETNKPVPVNPLDEFRIKAPESKPFLTRFQAVGGRACTPIKEVQCDGYLIRKSTGQCPIQPTCCGNSACDQGENAVNCPRDCNVRVEPKGGCPTIRQPACKGRLIYDVKRSGGCPQAPVCCGDGACQSLEGERSCPEDCAVINFRDEKRYCPEIAVPRCKGTLIYPPKERQDCTIKPSCCGDKVCDGIETGLSCPSDCGAGLILGSGSQPFAQKAKPTFRDLRTNVRAISVS